MYREPDYDINDPGVEMQECNGCGQVVPCMWGTDPFAAEINDDYTEMWLCNECDYQRAMDI